MKIWTVARFTLLRLARTRHLSAGIILAVLAFFAVPDQESIRSLRDLNFVYWLVQTVMWLFAIWVGNGLVAADRADGNLRSTLTRPISMLEYVAGKVLGGWLATALLAVMLTAGVVIGALTEGVELRAAMVAYPLTLLPSLLAVVALSAALSQAMPRFWALMLMLIMRDGLYTNETLTRLADFLPSGLTSILSPAADVLYWLSPATVHFFVGFYNFFYLEKDVFSLVISVPYAVHYTLLACLLATLLLNRKEL
jgi:ABC-type transport system involved in multi-copper enzyme maturation permease subunit